MTIKSVFEDVGAKLLWPITEEFKVNEDVVASWILGNNLILQRWDHLLFFQDMDEDEKFPVLQKILRFSNEYLEHPGIIDEYYAMEYFENFIQHKRKDDSEIIFGLAGVIITEKRITLILPNETYFIVKNKSNKMTPLLKSGQPRQVCFTEEITAQLKQFNLQNNDRYISKISRFLYNLGEAIVTLQHGALLIIRYATGWELSPLLHPLGPVWLIQPEMNMNNLEDQDIHNLALLASLDGATEIILNDNNEKNIMIRFRRSVKSLHSIWVDDQNKNNNVILADDGHGLLNEDGDNDRGIIMTMGSRHQAAYSISHENQDKTFVISISSDGPRRIWHGGEKKFTLSV